MKINLGSGRAKLLGFVNIDKAISVQPEVVADVEEGIPFKDNSIDSVYSRNLFEHVENVLGLVQEIWRVCKNEALVFVIVPHAGSDRATVDPTHKRFFTEDSWKYWDCRQQQSFDYGITSKFDMIEVQLDYHPDLDSVPKEEKEFWIKHGRNIIQNVSFIMRVIKP